VEDPGIKTVNSPNKEATKPLFLCPDSASCEQEEVASLSKYVPVHIYGRLACRSATRDEYLDETEEAANCGSPSAKQATAAVACIILE
jgi:hypothetical protein